MEERRKQDLTAEADGIIEGRNAVIEALRAGETIDKIYLQKGETDKTLGHIASKARAAGVVVVEADRRKLDAMSRTHAHQGVIALAAVREYVSVESILQAARDKGEAPLLVVCDEISDPHNLGAILRTADGAGVDAVIAPRDKSVGITETVLRVSVGAAEKVPFIQVTNLARTMKQLQGRGIWIFGTSDKGDRDLYETDFTGPAALVMGAEGEGMRRLTEENCDFLLRIPMRGSVPCLNVSVATGVCLYEMVRQRLRS